MVLAGGVTAMACDPTGLLASGSACGVISLVPTARHATGTTMQLLPPHQRLSPGPALVEPTLDDGPVRFCLPSLPSPYVKNCASWD